MIVVTVPIVFSKDKECRFNAKLAARAHVPIARLLPVRLASKTSAKHVALLHAIRVEMHSVWTVPLIGHISVTFTRRSFAKIATTTSAQCLVQSVDAQHVENAALKQKYTSAPWELATRTTVNVVRVSNSAATIAVMSEFVVIARRTSLMEGIAVATAKRRWQ